MKRKSLLFALLLALFMPWAAQAQETVEIGTDGGTTTNQYLPGYTLYDNTLSEQIYTAEEVTMAGTISSVAFYNGGSTKSPTVTLYMVNTDKEAFESATDWLTVTSSDQVFEGEVTFTANEWTTITLDEPFEYDGSSNLGLVAHIHMSQYSSGLKCYVFTSTDNCSMYAYRDNTVYDPTNPGVTGTRLGVKNQIKLEITPGSGSTCDKPSSISFGALNTHSVTVNWDGGSGTYNIEYKKASDEEWTERETNYAGWGISLTNLTPGTDYNVRVQSVCGDEVSGWKTGNFTTLCEPVTNFPWNEDFESYASGDFSNPCWVNEHIAGSASYLFQVSTATTGANNTHQLKLPDEQDGNMIKLVLPEMVLPSTNCQFSIDVYRSSSYSSKPDEGIRVYASRNGVIDDEQTVELAFIPRYYGAESGVIPAEATGNVWYTYELPIPMSSTCYIILRGESKYGTATYMDNFMVQEVFCDKPTDLAVSEIAATSATFDWTENGDATIWQICFNDDENDIHETGKPVNYGGLTPDTDYTVKVRSSCGDGNWSPWSQSISFTTLPSCLAPTNVQVTDITARTATVTWEDTNEEAPQLWEVELLPTTQEIWQSYSTENPFGGLVPETQYTVRVRAICDALNGDNSAWSETVTFTTLEACPTPSDLACTGVTGTTATLGWTENGEAETWRIEYAMNSDWSDLQSVEVTENPYTLEGLNYEATYRARVIAICGEENESHESNVVTFEPTDKILIGSGTGTISGLPFNNYYKQSLTQQIYTVEELGDAGVIVSIDFYKNNTTTANRTLDIYMVSTEKETFENTTDWIAVTAADLVFSGSVSFSNNAWTSIQLDEGFIYDGIQNVAIIVDDNTGSYAGSSNQPFLAFDATSQAISVNSDNTNYDPTNPSSYTGSIKNMKNQIRILKDPMSDCMKPTHFAVGEIGPDFVTLSWTENGASESWVICYTDYDDNYTQTVSMTDLVDGTYTLQGLNPATTYVANVIPACGVIGSEYNLALFSSEVSFTTLLACPAPQEVTVSNVLHYSADVAWTGYSDTYTVSYRVAPGLGDPIFSEGFEGGTMPEGWTIEGDNQVEGKTWRIGTGDYSASTGTHSGDYNALITHNNKTEETYLITPAMDMTGQSGLVLSFWYINRSWSGDTDGLGVYYRVDEGEWNELWSTTEAHGTWTNQTVILTGLTANYQLGFMMTDSYGYGVGLDDIIIAPEIVADWTTINNAETPQALTNLTAGKEYQVKVQGFCGATASEESAVVTFNTFSENYKLFLTEGNWNNADSWSPASVPTIEQDVELRANVTITEVAKANSINQGTYSITIEDGGQLMHNSEDVIATLKKNIDAYTIGEYEYNSNGEIVAQPNGYYLIAHPMTSPITPSESNGLLAGNYDFYDWYALAPDGIEWTNYRAETFYVFGGGYGYLYANEADTELSLNGDIRNSKNNYARSVTYNTNYEFGTWNLLGNPFACNAYLIDDDGNALPFYKMNDAGDGYEAVTGEAIAPLEGLFYEANSASEYVNFSRTAPASSKNGSLNMMVTQGRGTKDNAIIRFGEGQQLGKLSFRKNSTKLYIPQDGKDYAIVNAESNMGEMPVSFKAQSSGTYTLNFTAEEVSFAYLHLIDNMTGVETDLLETPSYTFEAKTTDYASRFRLVFATGNNGNDDNFAFFSNGSFVINNDGEATLQVVDVTGRIVKSESINGCANVNVNAAPGVYMIRLVNGDNVKVQKVVIK